MTRFAPRLAWGLFAVALQLLLLFVYLALASTGGPLDYDVPVAIAGYGAVVLLYPLLGALIASRQPSNSIGWMFCASGIAVGLALCSQLYAERDLFGHGGALPGGEIAWWASSWLFPVGLFVTPIFLLLLFPTGRASSRFWRGVVRIGIVVVTVGFIGEAVKPGRVGVPEFGIDNPFGLSGTSGDVAAALAAIAQFTAIPFFLLSLTSLVWRLRLSTGREHQQLKWFGFIGILMAVFFALSFTFSMFGFQPLSDILFVAGGLALISLPIASAVAILKHRLYDIDVVINRTLVYGILTAVLGGAYVGLVFAFQAVLAPFSAESDLAIAGSTLAIAALFRPVRVRVQAFIDHRFYRRKYDAQQTVERFNAQLRDEVDLGALRTRLTSVVADTVQPAHVSVWLRDADVAR